MTNQLPVPVPHKGWLPLVLITFLTVAILIISVIALFSGWLTIFQNLFYIPIILACVYYVKRGFMFSVLLACGYFVLMLIFSQDVVVLEGALIRVLIFILVAGVITYLSVIRIRAEDALKESEEFNRGLVENMPNLVVVYDHDRKIRYVNPAATTALGYSVEEMMGTDIMTYVNPRQHAEVAATIEERFSSDKGKSSEIDLITKAGQHLTVISKGAPLHFQNQPAVLILFADITDRKRAEEVIHLTNTLLSTQMEVAIEGILAVDESGKIISYNQRFTEIWGIPPDVIVSRSDEPVLQSVLDKLAHPEEFLTRVRYLYAHRQEKSIEEVLLMDGRVLERYSAPMFGENNQYYGRVWQFRDITERKRAEEALQQANKQLNLLSSITRHDILNQLMALKGYLELSHEVINNPTILIEYIKKEEQAANTIELQITFTKDYQELGVTAPTWQNANECIRKAVAGLPMREVHVEVDPQNPEVFADRLFEKVFYNLMDNALRYGGEKMTTIRVSSQEMDTSLLIVCEDDGVGIIAEDKKRLFTRGFGKNTGLGLFLSREILAITGITITENGVPGKGARFEITVPKGMWRMKGVNE